MNDLKFALSFISCCDCAAHLIGRLNRSFLWALYHQYQSGFFKVCMRYNKNRFVDINILTVFLYFIFSYWEYVLHEVLWNKLNNRKPSGDDIQTPDKTLDLEYFLTQTFAL